MKRINDTRPRRLHVIRNRQGLYVTVILFGWRVHVRVGRVGLSGKGLWG